MAALTSEERRQASRRQWVAERELSCTLCDRPWHAVKAWHSTWTDLLGDGCLCSDCHALNERSRARRLRDEARDDVAA